MAQASAPDWLTADFLQSCLESDPDNFNNITITAHTVEPAVVAGNNYGSNMLRVKIQYKKLSDRDKNHAISLIVKAPLTTDGGIPDEFKEMLKSVYEKEPKFYNEFKAETFKLCEHDILAKHYTSPNPLCIVLEDLSSSGYVMADRHELLDFDHCQLYVKASSKLHALSVAVHKRNPELVESLGKELQFGEGMKQFMIIAFQCMTTYLEDNPDYQEYLDVIKIGLKDNKILNLIKEMEESKHDLKALTQGDPWCTNMMFKYNSSGKVIGIKLLDFQNIKLTTPVQEFITFVWVSAKPEVRETKLNDLYRLYCDSLNQNLAELGCSERLSMEALKAEITFLSPLVLTMVCMMVPFCMSTEPVNMNNLISGNNVPIKETPMYKLYEGATFKQYFPQILHQVAKSGVFDYLKEKMSCN